MHVVDLACIWLELGLGKMLGECITRVGKAVDLEWAHGGIRRACELTAKGSTASQVRYALDGGGI